MNNTSTPGQNVKSLTTSEHNISLLNSGLYAIRVDGGGKRPGWNAWQQVEPHANNTLGLPLTEAVERIGGWLQADYNYGYRAKADCRIVIADVDVAPEHHDELRLEHPELFETRRVVNTYNQRFHAFFAAGDRPPRSPAKWRDPDGRGEIEWYGAGSKGQVLGVGSRVRYGDQVYGRELCGNEIRPLPAGLTSPADPPPAAAARGDARYTQAKIADAYKAATGHDLNRNSGELCGPCPRGAACDGGKNGGEDRFYIKADGRFYCRQCCSDGKDRARYNALCTALGLHDAQPAAGAFSIEEEQNRSDAVAALHFMAEHHADLVIVTDGGAAAKVYTRTDADHLSDARGRLGEMLSSTIERLALEQHHLRWRDAAGRKEFGAIARWLSRLLNKDAVDRIEAAIPLALGLRRRFAAHDPQQQFPVVVRPEDVDGDPRYLGVANGVLDQYTARLLTSQEVDARGLYITKSTGVDYKPDATHPDADKAPRGR